MTNARARGALRSTPACCIVRQVPPASRSFSANVNFRLWRIYDAETRSIRTKTRAWVVSATISRDCSTLTGIRNDVNSPWISGSRRLRTGKHAKPGSGGSDDTRAKRKRLRAGPRDARDGENDRDYVAHSDDCSHGEDGTVDVIYAFCGGHDLALVEGRRL